MDRDAALRWLTSHGRPLERARLVDGPVAQGERAPAAAAPASTSTGIADDLRGRHLPRAGYGERYGVSDDQLERFGRRLAAAARSSWRSATSSSRRSRCSATSPRCASGRCSGAGRTACRTPSSTQVAIDRQLTLIAFEAMNHWTSDGSFSLHVFHKNNELAGYCSVLHALQLAGSPATTAGGWRAVVIGFGATARGAVTALNALGVATSTCSPTVEKAAVASPIHSARIVHFDTDDTTARVSHAVTDDGPVALGDVPRRARHRRQLRAPGHRRPATFIDEDDLRGPAPGSVVIDVSCDEGMGFSWARPTTFAEPTFIVGDHVLYYAVDHSPSYLWDAATWEISEALLPFLRRHGGSRLGGGSTSRAIEIARRRGARTRRSCRSRDVRPDPHLPLAT